MLDTSERPSLDETYISACSSSNLRVENDAERRSNADIFIASGWSRAKLGRALGRLQSEYERPANSSTETDRRIMLRLTSLHEVLDAVTLRAEQFRIDRPEKVAQAVVAHWLDDVCRKCNKLGKEKIPGTPMLSNKACKACNGTGSPVLPYGEAGRRVEEYMLGCLQAWRNSTARRLFRRR